MSKRSREIAGSEAASASSHPSKKHRSSIATENCFRDALTNVLENADELGDCLQFLKTLKSNGQQVTMDHHFTERLQQLSNLGHRLAPSFQVLGSTDDLPAACNNPSVSSLHQSFPSTRA
jgi:hypothetical protein